VLKMEEVIDEHMEAEGRALVETAAEHVLTCFRSRDPHISLEPVVQGPVTEMEEAVWDIVQEITKLVAMRFER
jgi:hypothetical protein